MNEPLFQQLVNKFIAVQYQLNECNVPAANMEMQEIKNLLRAIQQKHKIFQAVINIDNPDVLEGLRDYISASRNFFKEVF